MILKHDLIPSVDFGRGYGGRVSARGIFTSGYLVLVVVQTLAPSAQPVTVRNSVPHIQEAAALALALCSLLLGLVPWQPYLSVSTSPPSLLTALTKALWPILGGAVLAVLLGRWPLWLGRTPIEKILVAAMSVARRPALVFSSRIELIDGLLRQWPAAALTLLLVASLFGAAMLAAR